jgi:two-component system, OmpR family, sensor kinase
MKLSLRNQLSLWAGLAILFIVFSVILITQQITVWSLENSLDENLQKRAYMVASIISSDITTDEDSYARVISDLASQKLSFVPSQLRVVSPSGRPIVAFGDITDPLVQQLNNNLIAANVSTGYFSTILAEGGEHLRSYTIAAPDPRTHSTLAYVQIVESMSQIEQTKAGLWRNGLIIGLVGSCLAIIIGQILLRRGFKSLNKIIEAVDQADYNHLKSGLREDVKPIELQQLAKSLSAMWLRLDMAASEKSKAVGNMSHDLRTPLAALQGQLEVLLKQPSLAPETRDSLERMLNETRRLTRLVKNMLLNVQLESQPALIVEDVNIKEILDETIGDVWILARGLDLDITAFEDVIIRGDRDLVKQALMNLVENAIKFTPKGGQVGLTLARDGDWAVIQIKDTGRGIPGEQLPHVMEAFHNVGKKSAGEGARLGLSIVKQIVEIHHGQIEIQSHLGIGTSVTLRLPKKSSSPLNEPASPITAPVVH